MRTFEGFVLDGPEYLTVFEVLTGRELQYVDSGNVPMSNPFADTPHGRDGTDPSSRR